jgi:hypothetical protein
MKFFVPEAARRRLYSLGPTENEILLPGGGAAEAVQPRPTEMKFFFPEAARRRLYSLVQLR